MDAAARWLSGRGGRKLWIALLVVVVVAGVAAVVWENRAPEQSADMPPAAGKFFVSPRLDAAPAPRWTVRAADLSDQPGAVLLAAPQTLGRYYGYGSPMDAGTMIVAATAVPDGTGSNGGVAAGPVRLHGIDPDTGVVRWNTDVGELNGCRERVFDGQLACRGPHRVLIVDATTGAVLLDRSTDFEVTDVTVREGVVSVAGRTEDRMTAVVTRGTVVDIAAAWQRTYPTPVPGDPVTPRIDAPDYFRDGHDRNVRVFDLHTGDPLFTGPVAHVFDGGILATQAFEKGWSAGKVALLDRTGHPLADVTNPSFLLEWYPTATTTPPPILTGETAYDRTTAQPLWTNPQLGIDEPTGRQTAVLGVVGNTVVVRSLDGSQLTGLDLIDGHQIWRRPSPFPAPARYDGITDGTHLILTDGTTAHAFTATDGTVAWSFPLPPSGDARLRSGVKAMGGRMVTTTARDFTGYAAG
ncbi:outer membrane protein assembly factor BamB family protein [Nocardia blacklockiae]|uniref:outer membrane protein assembly factor BamB family protein n=1 Tax=Nocardia blacklockiae TaxID=480036 RepID=UPI00189330DB|nr:PQQ-binding-like beta-propeller repeat protein [Nocardia blacklockiae]MBF6175257.1 PQQ-binding-like beta-propeller repeat protein [Nocardia blacklockiae]